MKKLSPLWFIKPPLDPELKEYILLDFLKNLGKKLSPENCYSILRTLAKVVKDLNAFKERGEIPGPESRDFSKEDQKIYKNLLRQNRIDSEKALLEQIVENALETIYEYSDLCLGILKEEEEKIKIFKIFPQIDITNKNNSGILLVRNMVSDQIIPYMWQGSVKMKTELGDKEICILKKIFVKNQKFSLNYEFIYHEILEEAGFKSYSPQMFVIEIYENFDEESEIYKFAKEKFIEKISK